ncbi:helix-turn-helix transcriptional regulator [Nocardiopsis flavescens]|uniref:helix-turn-helix domain-containing protein n=1 Tax=Nocardiopsis flavescens TaxID=758803 RepID=UPI003651324E
MTELRIVPEEEPESVPRAASPALEYYASELKRHREAAGLTQAQLAGLISYSKSMVSMVETAKRSPLDTREGGRIASKFTECCDEALNTGGALARILPLLDGSNDPYPPWFRPYAHLESEATAIYKYDSQSMPGLLQTEAYARALTKCLFPVPSEEEIDKLVSARMRRQGIFDRQSPPHVFFVVDEAVLKRRIGTVAVMEQQLQRLLDEANRPTVNLLVMPFRTGGHPAVDGSYSVLDLPDGESALYVEGPGNATITMMAHEVRSAQLRFLALCGAALPPSHSADLIEKYMGEA